MRDDYPDEGQQPSSDWIAGYEQGRVDALTAERSRPDALREAGRIFAREWLSRDYREDWDLTGLPSDEELRAALQQEDQT